MDSITVDKQSLVDKLHANREEHREIFDRAQVKYREAMVAELDRALQEARDGRPIRRAFSLPVPEDHTQDFDTAIEMLGWDQRESIQLDQRDFTRYVQNRWEWEASFASNTRSYTG